MDDTERINIYLRGAGFLDIKIENGQLEFYSEVWGDYDSEAFYVLSKADTDKLFSIVSLDEFIDICRQKNSVLGIKKYLDSIGISLE